MQTWKIEPVDTHVKKFVQCYWYLEKTANDHGIDYPLLNPDPAATWILSNANQPYAYHCKDAHFTDKGSHCLYPNKSSFTLDHSKPFTIVGIKLHVGALACLANRFRHPLIDSVDVIDIKSQLHMLPQDVVDILTLAAKSAQETAKTLDHLLVKVLQEHEENRALKRCKNVVNKLTQMTVSQLANEFHCSQRTLEREFLKTTGFTLKQCQSMFRLEQILETIHCLPSEKVDWLDITEQFGFSDQPHLIRHLKSVINQTPNQYLGQRHLTIDVYGDFSSNQ